LPTTCPGCPKASASIPGAAGSLFLMAGGSAEEAVPSTAGILRRAVAALSGLSQKEGLAVVKRLAEERANAAADSASGELIRLEMLRREVVRQAEARQHDSRLLQTAALERVVRYEAHVSRQLNQALQLLRQFKDERRAADADRASAPLPVHEPRREDTVCGRDARAPGQETSSPREASGAALDVGSFGNRRGAAPPVAPSHDEQPPASGGEFVRHRPGLPPDPVSVPGPVPGRNGRH